MYENACILNRKIQYAVKKDETNYANMYTYLLQIFTYLVLVPILVLGEHPRKNTTF